METYKALFALWNEFDASLVQAGDFVIGKQKVVLGKCGIGKEKAAVWLCEIAKNTYFAWYNEQRKKVSLDEAQEIADAEAQIRELEQQLTLQKS